MLDRLDGMRRGRGMCTQADRLLMHTFIHSRVSASRRRTLAFLGTDQKISIQTRRHFGLRALSPWYPHDRHVDACVRAVSLPPPSSLSHASTLTNARNACMTPHTHRASRSARSAADTSASIATGAAGQRLVRSFPPTCACAYVCVCV